MIAMIGNSRDMAQTGGRRLGGVAMVVFRDELRSVLKVGSEVPLLIVFFGISFPLGLVVKL